MMKEICFVLDLLIAALALGELISAEDWNGVDNTEILRVLFLVLLETLSPPLRT